MADNCKRIDWLSANYGKIKSDQIGHLPLGGLIASHTLEALKEKLNG
jgi:alpha/beta superfamily hydrolase